MNDIEKAIDILKEKLQISTTGLTVGELNDQKRALDLAISVLEKQLNGCWISASERLPDSNKKVLVYAKGKCRNGDLYTVGACHNGFWFLPTSSDTLGFPFTQHEVIAWMPLPEPYKEVENE